MPSCLGNCIWIQHFAMLLSLRNFKILNQKILNQNNPLIGEQWYAKPSGTFSTSKTAKFTWETFYF